MAESFEEGANISEVARSNGVARGLPAAPICGGGAGKAPSLVRIQIGAESGGGTAGESERISSAQTTPLEIAPPATKLSG